MMSLYEWLTVAVAFAGFTLQVIIMLQQLRSKKPVARKKYRRPRKKVAEEQKVEVEKS